MYRDALALALLYGFGSEERSASHFRKCQQFELECAPT